MSPVLTAPAYTKGVGQSRRVCHEREEDKAQSELNGSGRDGAPWKVRCLYGSQQHGRIRELHHNIRPVGVALRSAYARGGPSR